MRNYRKESEWMKQRYTELRAKLDKSIADPFKEKLLGQGITYSQWLKDRITKYMNEDR